MVQIIPTVPSAWANFGKGLGQGLAESVPKEISHYRKSKGLNSLAEQAEKGNLSPAQFLTRSLAIPGIKEAEVEALGKFARNANFGKALTARGNQLEDNQQRPQAPQQTTPFPQLQQPKTEININNKESASSTKPEDIEAIQRGYIPPTQQQKDQRAGQLYNENPAFFQNDPQNAINYVDKEVAQEEKIQTAKELRDATLTDLEKSISNRLREHSKTLGSENVPANVYSKVEDEAINSVKPKSQGGEGLTQQQAIKKYGDKMNEIDRQYSRLDSVGNWGITGKKASESLRSFETLQKQFAERGDTENLAQTLIGDHGLSPMFSYGISQPVSQDKNLNNYLKILQPLEIENTPEGLARADQNKEFYTERLAPDLARRMGDSSPLAIAYELKKKGYDPMIFLDYLKDHEDELDLKKSQSNQLAIPHSTFGSLNDWWLSSFTGIK